MDTTLFSKTKYQNLKAHEDGNTYLLDFRHEGKRYRKHIVASTLEEAYNTLITFKQKIEKQSNITANIHATVNEYWELLRRLKQWMPDHDYRLNQYYMKNIMNTIGNMKITEIKSRHFTAFNSTLKHYAIRTQKIAYEILKPLFELAIEDELIDQSPIKKSHIPVRKQLEEKKIITNAENKYVAIYNAIHKLFGSTGTITAENQEIRCSINPHHLALFLFGFHGRRLTETISLKWSDIDLVNDVYIIRGESSKVNTDMTFQLPTDIKNALLNMKNSGDNIFNVRHIDGHYKTIRKISGIQEFTFHWMRNLAVSALASKGVDVTHLSAMLGHNDAGTLKKYLSLQRTASTNITNDVAKLLLNH